MVSVLQLLRNPRDDTIPLCPPVSPTSDAWMCVCDAQHLFFHSFVSFSGRGCALWLISCPSRPDCAKFQILIRNNSQCLSMFAGPSWVLSDLVLPMRLLWHIRMFPHSSSDGLQVPSRESPKHLSPASFVQIPCLRRVQHEAWHHCLYLSCF